MTRRRVRPGLSEEDSRLWEEVRRSVTPLRDRSTAVPAVKKQPLASPATEASGMDAAMMRASRPKAGHPAMPAYIPQPPKPPKPTVGRLDDHTLRKLGKARIDIDGRIDLHGMIESRAHSALMQFLDMARRSDWRIVLVITGKGAHSGGILRNAVPRWLHEPPFSLMVSGYRTAHPSHGGEGALYVRLRRTTRRGSAGR